MEIIKTNIRKVQITLSGDEEIDKFELVLDLINALLKDIIAQEGFKPNIYSLRRSGKVTTPEEIQLFIAGISGIEF